MNQVMTKSFISIQKKQEPVIKCRTFQIPIQKCNDKYIWKRLEKH